MAENIPRNLGGYKLEREAGSSILKKVIFLIILALVLMYFFKREWFNMVIDYVLGFF